MTRAYKCDGCGSFIDGLPEWRIATTMPWPLDQLQVVIQCVRSSSVMPDLCLVCRNKVLQALIDDDAWVRLGDGTQV